MNDKALRGATMPGRPDITAETFDRAHGSSELALMWRLSEQAYGADYPEQIQPLGMTTWWTLGRFVAGLRTGPGHTILDLACGRGGVGLWLARATGANVIGVDFSPVAVALATQRAPEFVPADRATFLVGDLSATGMDSASIDGAICADAVFFATDRVAVFTEMSRILRPGGRFLFTVDESEDDRPGAVPDWTPLIEAGGLIVEEREQIPQWREQLQVLYDTWKFHIDEVRETMGDEAADDLIDEANSVGPTLPGRTGMIYTARRP